MKLLTFITTVSISFCIIPIMPPTDALSDYRWDSNPEEFNSDALIGANYSEKKIPYMAQVRFTNETLYGTEGICGGVLIKKDVVLTAANCLFKNLYAGYPEFIHEENLKVILGTDNRYKDDGQTITIKNFAYHYDYEPPDFAFDLAILYLDKNATENALTKTISNRDKPLRPNEHCTMYTFGQFWPYGPWPDKLFKIPVIVRSEAVCSEEFPSIDYGDTVCIQVDKKRYMKAFFCKGQVGSPVVCDEQLAGIISHERGCRKNLFALMTSTYNFRDWIAHEGAALLMLQSGFQVLLVIFNVFNLYSY